LFLVCDDFGSVKMLSSLRDLTLELMVNTRDSFVIFLTRKEVRLLRKQSWKRGVTVQTIIRKALGVELSGKCNVCNVSLLYK